MEFFIANKCINGAISLTGGYCEHCGEFEEGNRIVTVCDGSTWWCMECARYNYTDKEYKQLESIIK